MSDPGHPPRAQGRGERGVRMLLEGAARPEPGGRQRLWIYRYLPQRAGCRGGFRCGQWREAGGSGSLLPPRWSPPVLCLGEVGALLAGNMVVKSPLSPLLLPVSGCSQGPKGSLLPQGSIFGLLGAPAEADTCESLTFTP